MSLLGNLSGVLFVKEMLSNVAGFMANWLPFPAANIAVFILLFVCLFLSYGIIKFIPMVSENNTVKFVAGIILFVLVV